MAADMLSLVAAFFSSTVEFESMSYPASAAATTNATSSAQPSTPPVVTAGAGAGAAAPAVPAHSPQPLISTYQPLLASSAATAASPHISVDTTSYSLSASTFPSTAAAVASAAAAASAPAHTSVDTASLSALSMAWPTTAATTTTTPSALSSAQSAASSTAGPMSLATAFALPSPAASPAASASPLIFRPLIRTDLKDVRALHEALFPIRYPNTFFETACDENSPYYTCMAWDASTERVAGVVIAQMISPEFCDREDQALVVDMRAFGPEARLMYILTLGVDERYRRRAVGTGLMQRLQEHCRTESGGACKAIYLHVLTSNESATRFYEHLHFMQTRTLRSYYNIPQGDAFLYVLWINGGVRPEPPSRMQQLLSRAVLLLSHYWRWALRLTSTTEPEERLLTEH
eukprot:m.84081 g.84081  ORF g.84081 m.84081 type:complete len:404 (-) comp15006_c0_seq3:667-1878(-)